MGLFVDPVLFIGDEVDNRERMAGEVGKGETAGSTFNA